VSRPPTVVAVLRESGAYFLRNFAALALIVSPAYLLHALVVTVLVLTAPRGAVDSANEFTLRSNLHELWFVLPLVVITTWAGVSVCLYMSGALNEATPRLKVAATDWEGFLANTKFLLLVWSVSTVLIVLAIILQGVLSDLLDEIGLSSWLDRELPDGWAHALTFWVPFGGAVCAVFLAMAVLVARLTLVFPHAVFASNTSLEAARDLVNPHFSKALWLAILGILFWIGVHVTVSAVVATVSAGPFDVHWGIIRGWPPEGAAPVSLGFAVAAAALSSAVDMLAVVAVTVGLVVTYAAFTGTLPNPSAAPATQQP
jgi:hypothetical protein